MDSSTAPDVEPKTEDVKKYAGYFSRIASMPLTLAWLLSHKPLWAPAFPDRDKPKGPVHDFNHTLQQASGNRLPRGIHLVASGHLHMFEALGFGEERPGQLVLGNSGTERSAPRVPDPGGREIGGVIVQSGLTMDEFGFFMLEESAPGQWAGTAFGVDGRMLARCRVDGPKLSCAPVVAR